MTIRSRHSGSLLAAVGACSALVLSPTAAAQPTCVNTAPYTTQCTTNGSNAITTSPPAMVSGPIYGWPSGGGIVLGRW